MLRVSRVLGLILMRLILLLVLARTSLAMLPATQGLVERQERHAVVHAAGETPNNRCPPRRQDQATPGTFSPRRLFEEKASAAPGLPEPVVKDLNDNEAVLVMVWQKLGRADFPILEWVEAQLKAGGEKSKPALAAFLARKKKGRNEGFPRLFAGGKGRQQKTVRKHDKLLKFTGDSNTYVSLHDVVCFMRAPEFGSALRDAIARIQKLRRLYTVDYERSGKVKSGTAKTLYGGLCSSRRVVMELKRGRGDGGQDAPVADPPHSTAAELATPAPHAKRQARSSRSMAAAPTMTSTANFKLLDNVEVSTGYGRPWLFGKIHAIATRVAEEEDDESPAILYDVCMAPADGDEYLLGDVPESRLRVAGSLRLEWAGEEQEGGGVVELAAFAVVVVVLYYITLPWKARGKSKVSEGGGRDEAVELKKAIEVPQEVPFTQYVIMHPDIKVSGSSGGGHTYNLYGGQIAWQVIGGAGPLSGAPMGYFPARILEARNAVQPSMVNVARSRFDRKIVEQCMEKIKPIDAEHIAQTYTKEDAALRQKACGVLVNALWPWLCGLYHLGCASHPGGGAVVIEGSSTMKMILRGLHDHSKFVPILAAFLSWDQLERWQRAVCRGAGSKVEVAETVRAQVDSLRHGRMPGQDCPVKFSVATQDLLPIQISLNDNHSPGDMTDTLWGSFPDPAERGPGRAAGFKKHVETLLTLGNVNVLRWRAADTLDAFDVFGVSNMGIDRGQTTPRQASRPNPNLTAEERAARKAAKKVRQKAEKARYQAEKKARQEAEKVARQRRSDKIKAMISAGASDADVLFEAVGLRRIGPHVSSGPGRQMGMWASNDFTGQVISSEVVNDGGPLDGGVITTFSF